MNLGFCFREIIILSILGYIFSQSAHVTEFNIISRVHSNQTQLILFILIVSIINYYYSGF